MVIRETRVRHRIRLAPFGLLRGSWGRRREHSSADRWPSKPSGVKGGGLGGQSGCRGRRLAAILVLVTQVVVVLFFLFLIIFFVLLLVVPVAPRCCRIGRRKDPWGGRRGYSRGVKVVGRLVVAVVRGVELTRAVHGRTRVPPRSSERIINSNRNARTGFLYVSIVPIRIALHQKNKVHEGARGKACPDGRS